MPFKIPAFISNLSCCRPDPSPVDGPNGEGNPNVPPAPPQPTGSMDRPRSVRSDRRNSTIELRTRRSLETLNNQDPYEHAVGLDAQKTAPAMRAGASIAERRGQPIPNIEVKDAPTEPQGRDSTSPPISTNDSPETVKPTRWSPTTPLQTTPSGSASNATPSTARPGDPRISPVLSRLFIGAPPDGIPPLGLENISEKSSEVRPLQSPLENGIQHFLWAFNQSFQLGNITLPDEVQALLSAIPNSSIGSKTGEPEATGRSLIHIKNTDSPEPIKVNPWLAAQTIFVDPHTAHASQPSLWLASNSGPHSQDNSRAESPIHHDSSDGHNDALAPQQASSSRSASHRNIDIDAYEDKLVVPESTGLPRITLRRPTLQLKTQGLPNQPSSNWVGTVPVSPFLPKPPLSAFLPGPISLPPDHKGKGKALQESSTGSSRIGRRDDRPGTRTSKEQPKFTDSLPNVQLTTTDFKYIGHGAFSTVYVAKAILNDIETDCAIKTFKAEYQHTGQEEAQIQLKLLDELNGYSRYIVKYYGCMRTTTGAGGQMVTAGLDAPNNVISIAMELVKGPTADKLIKAVQALRRNGELPLEELLMITKKLVHDALRGAFDLQKKGLAHNDFKPDNLGYSEAEGVFKTMDLSNASRWLAEQPMGHPFYTPRERIGCMPAQGLGNEASSGKPTKLEPPPRVLLEELPAFLNNFKEFYIPPHSTSDSYAIGQIAHQLVEDNFFLPIASELLAQHKRRKFPDVAAIKLAAMIGWSMRKVETIFNIENESTRDGYAEKERQHYFNFVEAAMCPDFKKRLTPESLLEHPFITENYPDYATWKGLYGKIAAALADPETYGSETTEETADKGSGSGSRPAAPFAAPHVVAPTAEPSGRTTGNTDTTTTSSSGDLWNKPKPNV